MAEAAVLSCLGSVASGPLMTIVLEKSGKVKEHIKIIIYFNTEYRWLCRQLDQLNERFNDASSTHMRFPSANNAAEPLRTGSEDRVYYKILRQAEEILEDCRYENRRLFNYWFRLKTGRRIRDIREQIRRLGEAAPSTSAQWRDAQTPRLGLQPFPTTTTEISIINADTRTVTILRRASLRRGSIKRRLQPVEPVHVGVQSEIRSLTRFLVEDEAVWFVGLHGMGGVGKSAIVKNVWNSDEVQRAFENDLVIWLTVSSSTPIWLQRSIAREIGMHFDETWSEEQAKQAIYRNLVLRRYLLVLDDVWNVESNGLLSVLGVPDPVERSSKIVVTSRHEKVFNRIKPVMKVIKLNFLSEEKSWDLFRRYAFGDHKTTLPPEVERSAREFARACRGHPLALKACGAAMAGKLEPEEWQFASGLSANRDMHPETEREILNCLRPSYEALSRPLQLCFLYFAAFPENHIILTTDLIDLWTAERIGPSKESPSALEDCGRSYLKKLIDRCLVEKVEGGSLNRIRKCKMHQMLRLLAINIIEKEEKEEQCLFQAGQDLEKFPEDIGEYRRISLMYNRISSLPEHLECPELRTLVLRHSEVLREIPSTFFKSMTFLRTLDLSMSNIASLPESLGCLKRLVYLNLSRTKLRELPTSIERLKRLMLLNLFECKELETLPAEIGKLKYLKYLNLRRCRKLKDLPYEISKITCLQSLLMDGCDLLEWEDLNYSAMTETEIIGRRACSLKDLSSLNQLERLSLVCGRSIIPDGLLGVFENIKRLELCVVKVQTCPPSDIPQIKNLKDFRLSRWENLIELPRWTADLTMLRRITLEYLKVKFLPPGLEKLPLLRLLEIEHCYELTELPPEFGANGAFPALEELRVEGLTALEGLPSLNNDGTMPLVKEFRVRYCRRVKAFPEGLENLKSTTVIDIVGSPLLIEAVGQNGVDRERMKNCLHLLVM